MAETQTPFYWEDVVDQLKKAGATEQDYEVAKRAYFDKMVAPRVSPRVAPYLWEDFNRRASESIPEQGVWPEIKRGVERGLTTVGQGLVGSVASGMQSVERNFPGSIAPENMQRIRAIQLAQAQRQREASSGYSRWDNVHGVNDAARFVAANTGEGLGTSLPMLALPGGPLAVAGTAAVTELGNIQADAMGRAEDEAFLAQAAAGVPADQIDVSQAWRDVDTRKLAAGTGGAAALETVGFLAGPFGKIIAPRGMPGARAVDLLNGSVSRGGALAAITGKTLTRTGAEAATEYGQTFAEAYGAGNPDWTGPDVQADARQAAISAAGGALVPGFGSTLPRYAGGAVDQIRALRDASYQPDFQKYQQGELAAGNADLLNADQYDRAFYVDPALRQATRAAVQATPITTVLPDGPMPAMTGTPEDSATLDAAALPEIPTVKDLYAQMLADFKLKQDAAKPPKITEADYQAELDALPPDVAPEDIPAKLASFETFKKWKVTETKAKGPTKGEKAPTVADAARARQQMIAEREAAYGPQIPPQPVALLEALPNPPGAKSALPQPRGPQQADMFGEGGTVIPVDAQGTALVGEAPIDDSLPPVDPRQESLPFPVNDAASGRRFDAAFNRAERDAAKQRAREEEDAARRTRQRNQQTAQAQAEVDANTVAAETAPDLGLKVRQAKRLTRAQERATAAQQQADTEKANARQTFVNEANAAVGPDADGNPQIQPDDLIDDSKNMLFPPTRRGRPKAGYRYVDIKRGDETVGRVLRPVQPEASNEISLQETQPEAGPAPTQEGVLNPPPVKVAPTQEGVLNPTPVKAAPTADDLIAKIDDIQQRPKQKVDRQVEQDVAEALRSEAEGPDETTRYDDLLDDWDVHSAGTPEFFSAKSSATPARGVHHTVAQAAASRFVRQFATPLGVRVRVFKHAQEPFAPGTQLPSGAKGAYWPQDRVIGIFADAAHSVQDIETTIAHEVFGHFGLNTLPPERKQTLLSDIAAAKQGTLKEAFEKVYRDQPDIKDDDLRSAEEVFARAAEHVDDPFWNRVFDRLSATVAKALRFFNKGRQLSPAELRVTARQIAKGIRKGQRQQTFPTHNTEQYRALKDFVTDEVMPKAQGAADPVKDFYRDMVVQMNTTGWLTRWKPELKALGKIHQARLDMQKAMGTMSDTVIRQVENIRQLPAAEQKRLNRVMLDATRNRIHPDIGFGMGANAHLAGQEKLKPTYDTLRREYEQLSPEARKAYAGVRDTFEAMNQARREALEKLIDQVMSPRMAAKTKSSLETLTKKNPGPYFPLVRFGDYVAVWKSKDYRQALDDGDTKRVEELKQDPNHYLVSFEKTRAAAERQVDAWRQENGAENEGDSFAGKKVDPKSGLNLGMENLLNSMQQATELSLKGHDIDAKAIAEVKDALAQTFIASLPDTSIFISALKRENVAGVKPEQMLQAIAKHGGAQAFHISRLQHSHKLQEGLSELKTESRKDADANAIYDALAHTVAGLYTQEDRNGLVKFGGALQSLLYYSRLATSPAFWIQSALSPAFVSAPYMNGRHALPLIYGKWSQAALDAAKMLTFSSYKAFTRFSFADQIEASGLPKDEIEMLKVLEAAGSIDQSQVRELGQIARTGVGTMDEMQRLLASMAHRAEVLSRISTALTAYRLEKAKTKDPEAATRYAIQVVDDTLLNYSDAHTPLILSKGGKLGGPAWRMIFQFARYQIGMINLMTHTYQDAYGSREVSPARRAEARKQLTSLLAVHTVLTGTGGFFGINAMSTIVQQVLNAFYPDDDEPDIEKKARDLTDQIMGKDLSIAVRRGLPALLGLDLSGRMGMGDMLNLRRDNPLKGDRTQMRAQLVDAVPALSHFLDWIDWIKNPTLKRMPVSLVSNAAKAAELSDKGMTNTHGVTKIGAEEYGPADWLFQGLGFTPTRSTEAYTRQASDREAKGNATKVRQALMDELYAAMRSKDKDAVTQARQRIAEFNSRHKGEKKVVIDAQDQAKSYRQRQKREQAMDEYGIEQ
ncbi:MAG: PLxRFG domain-containing protein [Betaproteobacteria bacterium]|nr:PLxRFG domain-containing protein [Betaproteobacteria bacterium]